MIEGIEKRSAQVSSKTVLSHSAFVITFVAFFR